MSGYKPRHSRSQKEVAENDLLAQAAKPEALVPESPTLPGLPELPQAPKVPASPELSELPQAPKVPKVPELSELPELPQTPQTSKQPELSELLKTPKLPELPELSETPLATGSFKKTLLSKFPFTEADEGAGSDEDSAPAKTRKRRWPVIIAILLVLILVGGAITYYVLSTQALEREASRAAGYALLDESIALVQESDQVVISFDEAIAERVTVDNLSERKVLLDRVPSTLETLNLAEEKALAAMEYFITSEEKELAQQVVQAAINKREMLSSASVILTKDIETMNAVVLLTQAVTLIYNADAEFRATTELSTSGGYGELLDAITRNNVVLTNLASASDLITQAKDAFAEVDYSTIVTYLSLKTEAVQLAIAADQAILDGDLEAVNARNAEFSVKHAEAVEAASNIPQDPLTLIYETYDNLTAESRTLYDSARTNAAVADGIIREYVGVETQTGVQ